MTMRSELDDIGNTNPASLGGDYGSDDDYDWEDLGGGDDEPDDTSDYAEGWHDGYTAAMRHITWRYLLSVLIPFSLRQKYYALRGMLNPHNSDIPF